MKKGIVSILILPISFSVVGTALLEIKPVLSLPPEEDTPEEVLRTEIITQARSPVDGKPLSAAEYAELREQLQTVPSAPPQVNPEIQHLIFLLRLSYPLRRLFPSLKL